MSKTKKITPQAMEDLALKMIEFFDKKGFWYEMGIYVNHKRLASDSSKGATKAVTKGGVAYFITEEVEVKDYIEYSNPETLTIYFEGPLYHKINYDDFDYLQKLDEKFLKPFGLYFEQGHAWNMSAYE